MALLAARSPEPRKALQKAKKAGHAYVAVDGTLIAIDRLAADRPFYSGKHRRHGGNSQVIASPDGGILRVSGPLPGAVHDLKAARIWGIVRELATAGLVSTAGGLRLSPPGCRRLTLPGSARTPPARLAACRKRAGSPGRDQSTAS